MKLFSTSLIAFSLSSSLFALEPGEAVSLEAVTAAEFLKGDAPKEWKKGELYIFECWATWCTPCVAAIPHVDSLFDKYHEEGLTVIGMNVWEEGREKVLKFVTEKGDGISYPNAYVGKEGAFEKEWLNAAGISGIPYAFVVRDGEYLFGIHPASLTEDLIQDLLAGGERSDAVVDGKREAVALKKELSRLLESFTEASDAREVAKMKDTMREIQKLDAQDSYSSWMQFKITLAEEKWDEVDKLLHEMKDPQMAAQYANFAAEDAEGAKDAAPPELLHKLALLIEKKGRIAAYDHVVLASLYMQTDQKPKALEVAAKAVADPGFYSAKVLKSYADSLQTDKPQSLSTVRENLTAALRSGGE